MHALEAIDSGELVTVTGGADGDPPTSPDTNREQPPARGSLGGTTTDLLGYSGT
jgi:hypothetical protein